MKALLAMTLIVFALAGCGAREGSPDVYARIDSMTDCAALQAEFDQAWENHQAAPSGSERRDWSRGYMEAADARMDDIGCYR